MLLYQVIDPHDNYKVELFALEEEARAYQQHLEKKLRKCGYQFPASLEIYRCKIFETEEASCVFYKLVLYGTQMQYIEGCSIDLSDKDIQFIRKLLRTDISLWQYETYGQPNDRKLVEFTKDMCYLRIPVPIQGMTNEKRHASVLKSIEQYNIAYKLINIMQRSRGI